MSYIIVKYIMLCNHIYKMKSRNQYCQRNIFNKKCFYIDRNNIFSIEVLDNCTRFDYF